MRNSREKGRRRHRHTDFDARAPSLSEDALLESLAGPAAPLILVLDCVQDPHNLGACLRTADACGADAIVIPRDRSASLTETVRRVACGAAEHTPVVSVTNLARCLDRLREAGLWIVGGADQAEQTLYEADLTVPLAIAMGAEGKGLRRLTAEKCDLLVRIPMHPEAAVPCLNVSVASGVCLFEAARQRGRAR